MARNWRSILGIALSVVALCGVQSFADDSALSGIGGGGVAPMVNHPSVRMVSETVTIRLTDKSAKVHCEFLFRNEGKKCTVKMGFPEKAWASGEGSPMMRLSGFRSWVDGKPIKCVYKPGKISRKTYDERSYDAWYVKDIPFGAGQTRTVVDEYSTELGSSEDSMMTNYQKLLNFTYILRTGRNWKGPIGKAVIIVDTSGMSADHYELWPDPPGFIRSKGKISWTLTNFEPKSDISIEFIPRFPELNGKMVDSELWRPFSRNNGVTMTGPRFLEDLGAKVEYPETAGFFLIRYNGHTLRLTPGSKTAVLDGSNIKLQAAASTDTYPGQIPAASVVRALGGRARYSQKEGRLLLWLEDLSQKHH